MASLRGWRSVSTIRNRARQSVSTMCCDKTLPSVAISGCGQSSAAVLVRIGLTHATPSLRRARQTITSQNPLKTRKPDLMLLLQSNISYEIFCSMPLMLQSHIVSVRRRPHLLLFDLETGAAFRFGLFSYRRFSSCHRLRYSFQSLGFNVSASVLKSLNSSVSLYRISIPVWR